MVGCEALGWVGVVLVPRLGWVALRCVGLGLSFPNTHESGSFDWNWVLRVARVFTAKSKSAFL